MGFARIFALAALMKAAMVGGFVKLLGELRCLRGQRGVRKLC